MEDYPKIKFKGKITINDLKEAYALGMLKKAELTDGKYYGGSCRNASVAQWNKNVDCFYYMREKFGALFCESIKHPEDDDGHDLFIPFEKIEPSPDEVIKKADYSNYKGVVLSKKV